MDEKLARRIANIPGLKELSQFERNAESLGKLTEEVRAAVAARTTELGRELVAKKTGLSVTDLTPAEEKIIQAVSAHVGIKQRMGRSATRTIMQLRNLGLIESPEVSVAKAKPTGGFETLAAENLTDLSYEQIVIDHPDEFSDRALWYARRTLGKPNESDKPPASGSTSVQRRTEALLNWLSSQAAANNGMIPAYSNAEAAAAIGLGDMNQYGRVQGNIQSRLDFACYKAALPPIGLTAEAPFGEAWGNPEGRSWEYPVPLMQQAARSRRWSEKDFGQVLVCARALPGQAYRSWKAEIANNVESVRVWAHGAFKPEDNAPTEIQDGPTGGRNPKWTQEEHILALDLYLRFRGTSLGDDTADVISLSNTLGKLARMRGVSGMATFRNPNGVSMKMMNFRRFDPNFTSDGGVGLVRGSSGEETVWREFADNRPALAAAVKAIMAEIDAAEHSATSSEKVSSASDVTTSLQELAALEAQYAHASPEEKTRISRVVERGPIGAAVKRANGHRCQICEAKGESSTGFLKKDGTPYVEAHHVIPVAMKLGGVLSSANVMTLCANHHRHLHYGDVTVTIGNASFEVRMDGQVLTIPKVMLPANDT